MKIIAFLLPQGLQSRLVKNVCNLKQEEVQHYFVELKFFNVYTCTGERKKRRRRKKEAYGLRLNYNIS